MVAVELLMAVPGLARGDGFVCFGFWVLVVVGAIWWVRRPPGGCRRCRHVNRPGAQYCAQCGLQLRRP